MIITCCCTIFGGGKVVVTYCCTNHLNMILKISKGQLPDCPAPGCGPAYKKNEEILAMV